jgi:hypothetical protein
MLYSFPIVYWFVRIILLFLIIGLIPGIGDDHTNRFNTYKYLD